MKTAPYHIFKLSLLLLFLQSMYIWFLWDEQKLIIVLCLFSTLFFAITNNKKIFNLNASNLLPILPLLIIRFYVVRDQNENAFVAASLQTIIIGMIILLKDNIKVDLFQFFTKAFAIILSISVFAWILYLMGISWPHFEVEFGDEQYEFSNYYFFLYNHMDDIMPFPRFSSVFLEPGQLGMITSFLLCANRFDLKRKEILAIFIGTIFTFSLAAYILLAISSFVYLISYSKNRILNTTVWSIFLIWFYSFFSTYNNGVNVINDLIFSRFGSGNDDIIQNNRFSENMDYYFNFFINSMDFFTGVGAQAYNKMFLGANAGYKVFLIQHGVFGTVVVFLLYLSMVLVNRTKMAWVLFLVYILCFLQAAYPLWECELLLFITAMPFFKFNKPKVIYG
jgi:hypothetical protein